MLSELGVCCRPLLFQNFLTRCWGLWIQRGSLIKDNTDDIDSHLRSFDKWIIRSSQFVNIGQYLGRRYFLKHAYARAILIQVRTIGGEIYNRLMWPTGLRNWWLRHRVWKSFRVSVLLWLSPMRYARRYPG
jgi:hypothetical protein